MRAMARRDEAAPWRVNVLEAMLSALAVSGPTVVVITLATREPHFDAPIIYTGIAVSAVVALKFARFLSFQWRAALSVAMILIACLTWVGLTGFSMGATAGIVMGIVIAVMLLGRRAALTLLALVAAVLLASGLAAQTGVTNLRVADSDPRFFVNWLRMGLSMAVLTGALTVAVDYVVRYVETRNIELRAAYDDLAELHRKLETAKEEERRFIARELHDDLGQSLTVLKLGLKSGKTTPFSDPVRIVDALIVKVRELSRTLRPALLDEVGLTPALSAYLEEQSTISGVSMELDPQGFEGRLPGDLEIACFRLVQEAVTNALRHADAKHLKVHLERGFDALELRVEDDGRGFDGLSTLVRAALEGHVGVIGMRERVRSLGGAFQIFSKPGEGTRIEVSIPLSPTTAPPAAESRA
jgi:signal transduction histidine kinase